MIAELIEKIDAYIADLEEQISVKEEHIRQLDEILDEIERTVEDSSTAPEWEERDNIMYASDDLSWDLENAYRVVEMLRKVSVTDDVGRIIKILTGEYFD